MKMISVLAIRLADFLDQFFCIECAPRNDWFGVLTDLAGILLFIAILCGVVNLVVVAVFSVHMQNHRFATCVVLVVGFSFYSLF